MNSERRHELQENWLAGALVKANETIEPYSKLIGAAVVLGFAAMIGWGIYSARSSDNRSDATLQLIEASVSGNSEALSSIAAQYPKTSAANWSMLYQGGQKMAAGFSSLFNNRDEAEELLGEATRAYEDALGMSDDPVINSRAHFGLAQVAEALGDVDEAISHYESAMVAGESEAMAAEAKNRIERLSQPQTQEFLAWFNEQDFSPADPSLPPSLPDLGILPDMPDLELMDVETNADESNEDESPVAEGVGMEMPETETPATETPETETPATEEEPVGPTAPSTSEPTDAADSIPAIEDAEPALAESN